MLLLKFDSVFAALAPMTESYHTRRGRARLPAATKRRAWMALVGASALSGCAVSVPMPAFIDEPQTTGSIAPKAPSPAADARLPAKPSLELAAAQSTE